MNEERRFKIKKVKKYEEQLDNENKRMLTYVMILGIVVLAIFMTKVNVNVQVSEMQSTLTDNSLTAYYVNLGAEVIDNISIALNSAGLMISLNEKRKLQNKIDEIKKELGPLYDLYEQEYDEEESKGRGR